jgi:hypothetical protein
MAVDPEYLEQAQERAAKARTFFLESLEIECTRIFGSAPPRVMDAARALTAEDCQEPQGDKA